MEIGRIGNVALAGQLSHAHIGGVCQQTGLRDLFLQPGHTALILRVQLKEVDLAVLFGPDLCHQLFRLGPAGTAAVKDGDLPDTVQGTLGNNGLGRATGTYDGHFLTGEIHSQLPDRAHPAGTVCVAADEIAVLIDYRIHRPGQLSFRRDLIQMLHDSHLIGHGQVHAPHAKGAYSGHSVANGALVHVKGQINIVQSQLLEGSVVHERGL